MHKRLVVICVVVAACALTVVTAALAAGTTKHHHSSSVRKSGESQSGVPGGPGGMGGPGGPGAMGAVHSVSEVLNKEGTAYIEVTTDRGTIESVNSSEGTITVLEGTKSVTYKTTTLTIPSDATVTLDGKSSSLSALAAEDQVTVSSSSEGTTVFATDSSFHPEGGPGNGGPGGPGGAPGNWSSGSSSSSSSSSSSQSGQSTP
jgi:hypothetical protein